MPRYLVIFRLSQKGVENVKDSANRMDAAMQTYRDAGIEVRTNYATMGRYDGFAIVDSPNAATLSTASLKIESGGHVRTETRRIFTPEEYRKIIEGI